MMRSIVFLLILIITARAAYTRGSEVSRPSEENTTATVDHDRTLKKKKKPSKGRSHEDDSEDEEEPVKNSTNDAKKKKRKGHRSSGGGYDTGEDDSEETDSTTANEGVVSVPQSMVPTPTIFVFPTFNPVSTSTKEPTNHPYTKPPYSTAEENEDVPASVETTIPTADSLALFAFPTFNPMTTVTSEPTRSPLTNVPTSSPATKDPSNVSVKQCMLVVYSTNVI